MHTHEHTGFLGSVILHSLEEFIGILPFLFLTYLLMEFLEHKAGSKMELAIKRAGKVGPLWGGLLGIVPQCGFSAAASGLYAGRVISLGTLIAVFLSTSDEMLPLMIGHAAPLTIVKIVALKAFIAVIAGFLVDFFARIILKKREQKQEHRHHSEHHHHDHDHDHEHEHEHEHHHEHEHEHTHTEAFAIHELCEKDECGCEDEKFWLSALIHTAKTGAFLLLVVLLLNTGVFFIGEESLTHAFSSLPVVGHLLAGLVGLIPNCAASVVITKLYLEGMITAGCMFSGLLVGAGMGVLLLFRIHPSKKKCFAVLGLLYGIGTVCGMLIDLCGIGAFL